MEEDKGSIWWGVLGFFVPIVGLILFILWNKTRKKSARQAGIGALIRVIISFIFGVILTILFFALAYFSLDVKDECKNLAGFQVCCDESGECTINNRGEEMEEIYTEIKLLVNDRELTVRMENNSSADALLERLEEGDITINAHDYGNFEKVGSLGFELPTNDKYITTEPGDLILYNASELSLYYDTNSYSLTKLGHVINISDEELKKLLEGDELVITLKSSAY